MTSKVRNKRKHFLNFYHISLLLTDDISLTPGPCQMQFNDNKICEPLKT